MSAPVAVPRTLHGTCTDPTSFRPVSPALASRPGYGPAVVAVTEPRLRASPRLAGFISGLSRLPSTAWSTQLPVPPGATAMKVWLDQDLCTGVGLCEEIAPDVITLLDDGLAYVKGGDKAVSDPGGAVGRAVVPAGQEEATIESAEECPGECIFIEVD